MVGTKADLISMLGKEIGRQNLERALTRLEDLDPSWRCSDRAVDELIRQTRNIDAKDLAAKLGLTTRWLRELRRRTRIPSLAVAVRWAYLVWERGGPDLRLTLIDQHLASTPRSPVQEAPNSAPDHRIRFTQSRNSASEGRKWVQSHRDSAAEGRNSAQDRRNSIPQSRNSPSEGRNSAQDRRNSISQSRKLAPEGRNPAHDRKNAIIQSRKLASKGRYPAHDRRNSVPQSRNSAPEGRKSGKARYLSSLRENSCGGIENSGLTDASTVLSSGSVGARVASIVLEWRGADGEVKARNAYASRAEAEAAVVGARQHGFFEGMRPEINGQPCSPAELNTAAELAALRAEVADLRKSVKQPSRREDELKSVADALSAGLSLADVSEFLRDVASGVVEQLGGVVDDKHE